MRPTKFRITLQHEETGRITQKVYDYADVFCGNALREIDSMNRYFVIGRDEFTGLLDSNGKEIYEGDIVQLKNNICYVEWRDCGFALRRDNPGTGKPWEYNGNLKGYCDGLWSGPPEAIGNIYENPDLLK